MNDRRPDRDDHLDFDRNRDLADHVDAVWDALVRGAPSNPDPLAPELTEEANRLHALDRPPDADPLFLARLREELTMPVPAPLAVPLAAPSPVFSFPTSANVRAPLPLSPAGGGIGPWPRRWWSAVERMVAAVLVLGLIGSYVALGARGGGQGDVAASLYLIDRSGRGLNPLDPGTLADAVGGPVVLDVAPNWNSEASSADVAGDWAISADGSILVSVEHPARVLPLREEGMTVVVRDGLTGPERSRFRPATPILTDIDLSRDGGRLLAEHAEIDPLRGVPVAVEPRRWTIFDTVDGRSLGTITATEPAPYDRPGDFDRPGPYEGPRNAWLAPDGRHVWRLALDPVATDAGPAPIDLVVHDAESGAEVARIDLPGLRVGAWTTGRVVDGKPVLQRVEAGYAFSPDGRRLALVHEGGGAITLVDAERFRVERTVAVRDSSGATPSPAEGRSSPVIQNPGDGPFEQGRSTWAVFGADGAALFVGGFETVVDADARASCRDVATKRVDLRSGAITAERGLGPLFETPALSPDGGSLYAIGGSDADSCFVPDTGDVVLQRLDAETLEPGAERRFEQPRWEFAGHLGVEVVPRAPEGS